MSGGIGSVPRVADRQLYAFLAQLKNRAESQTTSQNTTSIDVSSLRTELNAQIRALQIQITELQNTSPSNFKYRGEWDASSGKEPSFTLNNGDYWVVVTPGTTALGDYSSWVIGDWAVYSADGWQRVRNASFSSRYSIPSGETLTIPAGHNLLIVEGIDIDGELDLEGELVEVN